MVFSVTPPSPSFMMSSSPQITGAQRSTSLPVKGPARTASVKKVVGFSVVEPGPAEGSLSRSRHASLPPRARVVTSAAPLPPAAAATVTVGFELGGARQHDAGQPQGKPRAQQGLLSQALVSDLAGGARAPAPQQRPRHQVGTLAGVDAVAASLPRLHRSPAHPPRPALSCPSRR
jgi:hypothetical protein